MKSGQKDEVIAELAQACDEALKLLDAEFPELCAGVRVSVKDRLMPLDSYRVAALLRDALNAATRSK